MQSEFFVWQPECLFSLAALSLRAPGPGRAVCGTMKRLIQTPYVRSICKVCGVAFSVYRQFFFHFLSYLPRSLSEQWTWQAKPSTFRMR